MVERLERLGTTTKVTKEELLMKCCLKDYPLTPKEMSKAAHTPTAATIAGGAPSP